LSEPLTAEHKAFVSLVRELRSAGALRVRDGGLEVVFAEAQEKPEAEKDKAPARVAYSKREETELAELRALKGELEERGVI
jgi:hypothetical protein